MLSIKDASAPILTTFITFSSNIALAAEDSISSYIPPIWPFIAIVLFIFIFRKQLNCVPPFKPSKPGPQEASKPPVIQQKKTAKLEEANVVTETVITEPVISKIDTEINNNIIDLKDNSQQCQASTTKGTRCKRKTTLEDTSVTINDKNYLLTVCKQHNTSSLKPFSDLIK